MEINAATSPCWFDSLRNIKSLGETKERPGSLGGLAAARRENLAQYFTPDDVAGLMWRILLPEMESIRRRTGCKVSVIDNSIGKGSLIQFARADQHKVAGIDIHGESLGALGKALEAAGVEHDLLCANMTDVRPKRYDIALANPPFSVHLQSVHMMDYACTSYGRFGPNTSAMSHPYALAQALAAAEIGVVLLPTTYAHHAWNQHESSARFHALVDLPARSFIDQGTAVEVSLIVFGAPMDQLPVHVVMSDLADVLPDLNLGSGWRKERRGPKQLALRRSEGAVQCIHLPVTGDKAVRVFRAGRNIRLGFNCGLVQAKVMNGLLRGPVTRSEQHRYPRGVNYLGEGALIIGAYLMQDDPVAALQATVSRIADLGGSPDVDPGLLGYMRRMARRVRIDRTPLRHVVRSDAVCTSVGIVQATAKANVIVNPKVWVGPVIRRGDSVSLHWDGYKYTFVTEDGQHSLVMEPGECAKKFDIETAVADSGWIDAHPGRLTTFPALARCREARFQGVGLEAVGLWEFQREDAMEITTSRGGVFAGEMGCGKSYISAAVAMMGGLRNAVVVEPHLIEEYTDQLKAAAIDESLWQVIETEADARRLKVLNIVSYNTLRKQLPGRKRTFSHLLRRRFNTVACDEGHALKAEESLRTQAVWQLSPKRRYVFTGTPIPNLVQDLLGLVGWAVGNNNAVNPYGRRGLYIEPRLLTSMDYCERAVDRFSEQHCVFEWVTAEWIDGLTSGGKRQVPKINNVQRLREWLAPVLKRRIVAEPDVAKHFKAPVCTSSITTLDWDHDHLAYFLTVADEFSERYRRIKADAEQGRSSLNMVALLARISAVLKAGNQPSYKNEYFGSYMPMTSKERYLVERASNLAAEGRKILLYVDGPEMSERLAAELNHRGVHAVPFHGKSSIKSRTRRMNSEFRYGPASVLVASYGTGQTGLNLYQANYVLLAVRAWNSKTERQAIARTLRPQQTSEVHVEFVHLGGSLDEYQAQVCQWKQVSEFEAIDLLEPEEVLDDYKHLDRIINEFVDRLAARQGIKGRDYRQATKAEIRHAA
ncbi:SNF2-related protein [Xanthomonas citri pv. citri]|uniref:SNF2-related protein n=1 Tax=Xanthomonas citri TaxID=346 RepID=UPI000952EB1F|nr:SNF2-related protein [Xanthomonas citri]MBD5034884.1 hypothetical protein [Xanthomonas citri pv. citri]MBD5054832.1 hypothetical protein [Xanthomonas citri pv. citri]OLR69794.1 hypothetical protein BI311_24090 [Xanthomonas citri pv. citri]